MGVRDEYSKHGVDGYYKKNANSYVNPHFDAIEELLKDESITGDVLDLSCGNGEATTCLDSSKVTVVGCDPYMYFQYATKTGNICYNYTFDNIISGSLSDLRFDVIICSFAMHLCEQSKIDMLVYRLACISKELIILTPNKNPKINNNYWDIKYEKCFNRVRLRRYRSKLKISEQNV